jgi:apolipoprotein D and lipocalin family protein
MIRLVLAALLLTACAPKPVPEAAYRDTTRQVYSIAAFDPARMAGHWVQVAGFGTACSSGEMQIADVADYALCLPSGVKRGQAPMVAAVPGRFDLPGIGPFWVLWADIDDRTLVIGAPSGHYAMILNRDAKIPADRLKAARDIMEFNGYDTMKLKVY